MKNNSQVTPTPFLFENIAASCPICHRAQHHSKNKAERRAIIKDAIGHKYLARNVRNRLDAVISSAQS